jgi:protein-disulfide isomerase
MSTNDDLPGSPAERSPKRKRRPVDASGSPISRAAGSTSAPRRAPAVAVQPDVESKQWSTGQLIMALAVGLAAGGVGGYLASSHEGGGSSASKEQGSAQASSQKGQQPPQPGAYVPLASWTPREGAEQAKVTIVEFSDFQ